MTATAWNFGVAPQDVSTFGTVVVEFIGGCTCYGPDPGEMHWPECGHEPIGELGDNFHPATMWDFSFVGSLAGEHP